jgi:SAM-dependent methyltransferase
VGTAYSETWFDMFLRTIPAEQTAREIAFVARQLPPPPSTVLDLCCGPGRHAGGLSNLGYLVTGVDLDARQLDRARREIGSSVVWMEADMRRLDLLPGQYDGLLILWQSFGFFDDSENAALLRAAHTKLTPGGRLILDVYHRGFFVGRDGERLGERGGIRFVERKRLVGNRLLVTVDYGDTSDHFDWRLYTPEELTELAGAAGLSPVRSCSDFDEAQPATPQRPRMQLVFERPVTE